MTDRDKYRKTFTSVFLRENFQNSSLNISKAFESNTQLCFDEEYFFGLINSSEFGDVKKGNSYISPFLLQKEKKCDEGDRFLQILNLLELKMMMEKNIENERSAFLILNFLRNLTKKKNNDEEEVEGETQSLTELFESSTSELQKFVRQEYEGRIKKFFFFEDELRSPPNLSLKDFGNHVLGLTGLKDEEDDLLYYSTHGREKAKEKDLLSKFAEEYEEKNQKNNKKKKKKKEKKKKKKSPSSQKKRKRGATTSSSSIETTPISPPPPVEQQQQQTKGDSVPPPPQQQQQQILIDLEDEFEPPKKKLKLDDEHEENFVSKSPISYLGRGDINTSVFEDGEEIDQVYVSRKKNVHIITKLCVSDNNEQSKIIQKVHTFEILNYSRLVLNLNTHPISILQNNIHNDSRCVQYEVRENLRIPKCVFIEDPQMNLSLFPNPQRRQKKQISPSSPRNPRVVFNEVRRASIRKLIMMYHPTNPIHAPRKIRHQVDGSIDSVNIPNYQGDGALILGAVVPGTEIIFHCVTMKKGEEKFRFHLTCHRITKHRISGGGNSNENLVADMNDDKNFNVTRRKIEKAVEEYLKVRKKAVKRPGEEDRYVCAQYVCKFKIVMARTPQETEENSQFTCYFVFAFSNHRFLWIKTSLEITRRKKKTKYKFTMISQGGTVRSLNFPKYWIFPITRLSAYEDTYVMVVNDNVNEVTMVKRRRGGMSKEYVRQETDYGNVEVFCFSGKNQFEPRTVFVNYFEEQVTFALNSWDGSIFFVFTDDGCVTVYNSRRMDEKAGKEGEKFRLTILDEGDYIIKGAIAGREDLLVVTNSRKMYLLRFTACK